LHARNEGDQKPEDEAGSVEISFDIVELGSIVQSAIAMVHGTDQAEGRKVSTEGFDEKIRLRADQRSLKQMLLNLSSSLADATGRVSRSVA
jgi:C4-dicarboxylate-specific signal transduction histidine kinase